VDAAVESFVERMGLHFEAEGIPRIGGRLFGYLLLQDDPCSLDDLADDLQVSKASISSNARLLEQWQVIRRVTRPGDRRDYYVAAHHPTRMLEHWYSRVQEFGKLLEEARRAAPEDRRVARQRLDSMKEFNTEVAAYLGALMGRASGTVT
jgi:DNA-binding transcriptional regulator GbsR (MarR family)